MERGIGDVMSTIMTIPYPMSMPNIKLGDHVPNDVIVPSSSWSIHLYILFIRLPYPTEPFPPIPSPDSPVTILATLIYFDKYGKTK